MGISDREQAPLPLVAAIIPPLTFHALTILAEPPWPCIDSIPSGYAMLSISLSLPMLVLACPDTPGTLRRLLTIAVISLAAPLLCLHAGLSTDIVFDLDAGTSLSRGTIEALAGLFLASFSIPLAILALSKTEKPKMWMYITVCAFTGAACQMFWFTIVWIIEGASGIHFWLWSRVLIHTATGLVAGVLAGGARIYRPSLYPSYWAGMSELIMARLPRALPLSIFVAMGLVAAGTGRIVAERNDADRFATNRLDEYFLSLSNLNRARVEGLVYAELLEDLGRTRKALLGAAGFDSELVARMTPLLESIEDTSENANHGTFKRAALHVNRRLLAIGQPFFLEPHVINDSGESLSLLLRYSVTSSARHRLSGGGSIPVLRLRRLDDILVDTPYTGLSYEGLGTVLMDHIDDAALRSYSRLFSPGAVRQNPADGRFAATRALIKANRRDALLAALSKRGHDNRIILEQLAALGERWSQVADISKARAEMSPDVLAAYDALTEILARQTEVHEARHAFDGDWRGDLEELEELSAGDLKRSAGAETRAYLSEIIDGPLGPKFALATIGRMIAGTNARANAYFFAAVVIVEGLWSEKIRRPDIIERDSASGPKQVVTPITSKNPGWLSYSRIHGAYMDLHSLPPEELRQRAAELFRDLFNTDYRHIKRHR
ncbi:MAG: hypothetical protein GY854_24430 [Deltaproteobacteria bacterium]|nr:hypothetical protein [Deltaproteobacteria bacterium]